MNYEILVRKRGENDYAAYCPQLDLLVRGTAHGEVEEKLKRVIEERTGEKEAKSGDTPKPLHE